MSFSVCLISMRELSTRKQKNYYRRWSYKTRAGKTGSSREGILRQVSNVADSNEVKEEEAAHQGAMEEEAAREEAAHSRAMEEKERKREREKVRG